MRAIQCYPQQRALDLDSLRSSHAIEVECKNSADVGEIFDAISYSKGASVIRMLADMIGLDAFQKGLQAYLAKHKYSNALSSDLWAALSVTSGQDVPALMETWTKSVGYPIVSLEDSKGTTTVQVSQERFFATGADSSDETVWPIKYAFVGSAVGDNKTAAIESRKAFDSGITIGAGKLKSAAALPMISSDTKAAAADGLFAHPPFGCARLHRIGQWLKCNRNMNGIFRVKYTSEMLAAMAPAISTMDARDRYQIISDLFSLSKAGYADTADVLKLLPSYAREQSFVVVSNISHRLAELQSVMFEEPEEIQLKLSELARDFFSPMAERLGWEAIDGESHENALLRPVVIGRAAKLGDPALLDQCRERFARFADGDAGAIHPDLRGAVFSTILKYGGMDEFDQLVSIYKKSDASDAKVTVLRALGSSQLAEVHVRALEFTMGGDVRDQDLAIVMGGLASNPKSRMFMWKWFCSKFPVLHERFYKGSFMLGRMVQYVTGDFASEKMAAELQAFFDGVSLEKDAIKRAIAQGVESVGANANWLDACRSDVSSFLAK